LSEEALLSALQVAGDCLKRRPGRYCIAGRSRS
jgi:hypothetical protein